MHWPHVKIYPSTLILLSVELLSPKLTDNKNFLHGGGKCVYVFWNDLIYLQAVHNLVVLSNRTL